MFNGTQMRLGRPPGVSHSASDPHIFPQNFLPPFPAGNWLHSPPILMHSFHLATPWRPLPSAFCCQGISMAVWLTDSEPDAHFSQWQARVWLSCVAKARLAWCWNGWIQCMHVHRHTQRAMDHLAAQSIWAVTTVVMYHLCPHCLAFCFEHVDRCIILAFDKFPYIHGHRRTSQFSSRFTVGFKSFHWKIWADIKKNKTTHTDGSLRKIFFGLQSPDNAEGQPWNERKIKE